jgi:hypothetical protein
VRDLPNRSLRWPVSSEARLTAACFVLNKPPWEVLTAALEGYVRALDADTRTLIERTAKARAKQLRKDRGEA